MNCPVCGNPMLPLMNDYARCPSDLLIACGSAAATTYEEEYFFDEYKKQYGRTYLDDKEFLQKRFRHRLHLLQKQDRFLAGKSLLEIGSAAGFFLEVAEENGLIAEGWEISRQMTLYAESQGRNVKQGSFVDLAGSHIHQGLKPYDIVAMFYVLEHFPDQQKIWDLTAQLVRPGGFLLLALPSAMGPLYIFQRDKWIQTHPGDHFADYAPNSLRRVARRFDFLVRHVSSEGIHPSRFPGGNLPVLKNLYALYQKLVPFSDTMFSILQKKVL